VKHALKHKAITTAVRLISVFLHRRVGNLRHGFRSDTTLRCFTFRATQFSEAPLGRKFRSPSAAKRLTLPMCADLVYGAVGLPLTGKNRKSLRGLSGASSLFRAGEYSLNRR
jgi:hypothetical protein